MDFTNCIVIKGARENNLKNIDVIIPRNKLVVLTGLSGSGKSTIAFETLQTECQRQYMESMGQVTEHIRKPKVDSIKGLSPSISIDQRNINCSPRSTVGTTTDIFTYLRLLYSRAGHRFCPSCGREVVPDYNENDDIDQDDGDSYEQPETNDASEDREETYDTHKDNSIGGKSSIGTDQEKVKTPDNLENPGQIFCSHCGAALVKLTMAHFSFNKPEGACPTCSGIGRVNSANIETIINNDLSILDGAVEIWHEHEIRFYTDTLKKAAEYYGFSFDPATPVGELEPAGKALLLYGVYSNKFRQYYPNVEPPSNCGSGRYLGIVNRVVDQYNSHMDDESYTEKLDKYVIKQICPECRGSRLGREGRETTAAGRAIWELADLSLYKLKAFIGSLVDLLPENELMLAFSIITEVNDRLERLIDVGLGYLSLSRGSPTLSGGEAQRLRLAYLLGSGLTGVLYVLDEPTAGLHQHDTGKLIEALKKLRDLGNTVLVIEHDKEMMRAADHIIDVGPGAGKNGGCVVTAGSPADIIHCEASITGKCLAGMEGIKLPISHRQGNGRSLSISGAAEHNLKNIDIRIPLGTMTAVTGVSGCGKSTLIFDVIGKAARVHFDRSSEVPGKYKAITGFEHIDRVIVIDQAPIGKTPRSNAATYIDAFTPIRNFFAALPEAKARRITANYFSFNVSGGRCEKCGGAGVQTIYMSFLPPTQVMCPACKGKRFKKEVLGVRYDGYSITDVLDLSVEDAAVLFKNIRSIYEKLSVLCDVGLGYLKLGQPATTLSGGEAQRVKLVKELCKKSKGHTLYMLDEPTTGLHPYDTVKLAAILNRLVDNGNTVILIEHNIDLIRMADHVIDMGPEGGENGGRIVAEGTPEQVAQVRESLTGRYL